MQQGGNHANQLYPEQFIDSQASLHLLDDKVAHKIIYLLKYSFP